MNRKSRRKTRRTTRSMHSDAPALEKSETNLLRWFEACVALFTHEIQAIMRRRRS